MQYRQELQRIYPQVEIVGRNFPPSAKAVLCAQIGQYLFFAGIAVCFMGDGLFNALGWAHPEWYLSMKNNKMQTCLFLWFMNSIATSQMATGAFEVSFDGELIFSKIETNRLPSMTELVNVLNMRVAAANPVGGEDNWQ